MLRAGSFQKQDQIWVHVTLQYDDPEMKSCNIEVFDEHGLVISVDDIRCAKYKLPVPQLNGLLYTTTWIESKFSDTKSQGFNHAEQYFTVVKLSECPEPNKDLIDDLGALSMIPSEINSLLVNEIPPVLLIPLFDISDSASSSSILEQCLLLLQTLSAKLSRAQKDDSLSCVFPDL